MRFRIALALSLLATPAVRAQTSGDTAAAAKVVMADWIDYLQLARTDGHWLIVNVRCERKPDRKA